MAQHSSKHRESSEQKQTQVVGEPPPLSVLLSYYRFHIGALLCAIVIASISFAIVRRQIPEPTQQVQNGPSQTTGGSTGGSTGGARGMNMSADTLALIQRMQDTIAQNPARHDVELRLANMFYDMGAFPMASMTYAKYLQAEPSNVPARIDYAYTLLRMGKSEEAVAETKTALKKEPDHPIATFNLGVIYYQLGQMEEAKIWLKKAQAIAPNSRVSEGAEKILTTIK